MTAQFAETRRQPIWLCLLVPTLAGGLGWGIRGQFGHESGAMIPGVLIALSIAILITPSMSGLRLARLAALGAVGFSFGASMTYGQTLGLTQNMPIRETAYWWGLLGTTIKGAIWVGLAGGFMGIAMSRRRYGVGEIAGLLVGMTVLWILGVWLLNLPLDKNAGEVPRIYFSDYWNVGKEDWKPRMELWGGLGFALAGLIVYLGAFRRDWRTVGLTFIGLIAGGCGFTFGQSLQAACHWHAPWPNAELARYVSPWKIMEVTFGLVNGFVLAIGCLLLYSRIDYTESEDEVCLSPSTEGVLFVVMALWMYAWNLKSYGSLDVIADVALTMGIIPAACIVGGRLWPYLGATAYIVIPIGGKVVRSVVERQGVFAEGTATVLFLFVPLVLMLVVGLAAMRRGDGEPTGVRVGRWMLYTCVWVYTVFSLSQSVFRKSLWLATDKDVEAAGGMLGLIKESLGAALTVETSFLVMAILVTVLVARTARRRNAQAA